MKQRTLFDLNILGNSQTHVYVILPNIINSTFEIISMCIDFLGKYQKLTFLCDEDEYSFYKLLFLYSATFASFKNIEIDLLTTLALKTIQTKNCLIVSLKDNILFNHPDKRAICCSITSDSDFVFTDMEVQSQYFTTDYLKNLLKFLNIEHKKLFSSIDISPQDITKASLIAKEQPDGNYNVLMINNIINALKFAHFLKKNSLKQRLVVISKNKLMAADPMLKIYKDYDLLDLIAIQLQARNAAMNNVVSCQNILNSLRISLSLKCTIKDSYFLLRDISHAKVTT